MRAIEAALAVPWAIRPEALQMLLDIAARSHIPDLEEASRRLAARQNEVDFGAVSVSPGTRLDGTRVVRMRGDVAVVPVEGPIFRYANLFSSMSGATSLEQLSQDFNVALNSPDVRAILLHVDSPGGEVNGTGEFADMIYAARSKKPIWAYVSNEGASAAYWIASACDRVVCAPTSLIGSIGVVAAVPDPNSESNNGKIQFVSSQSPNKRPDPTTDTGKAQIQTLIDDIADQFIATVARNRSVDTDTVLSEYGAGNVMVGQKSVDAGLSDEVSSFEKTLVALANSGHTQKSIAANAGDEREIHVQEGSIDLAETQAASETQRPSAVGRLKVNLNSIKERVLAAFEGASDEDVEAREQNNAPEKHAAELAVEETPPAQEHDTTPPQPTGESHMTDTVNASATVQADPSELRALREQLAARDAQLRKLQSERILERASTFVEKIQAEQRIVPAEAAGWTQLYAVLAETDSVLALESGNTRVAMLEAALMNRPAHMLSAEQVPDALNQVIMMRNNIADFTKGTTTRTPNGQPMTADRKRELLAQTDLGKEVLASREGARRN